MSKDKKECAMFHFTENAFDRAEANMHCNTIVMNNQYEPEDYVVQRHLNNLIATFGRKFVAEVIHNMALDNHSFNKKVG